MSWQAPNKVLITGGHELGGVTSFAEGLSGGFSGLGIPSEIIRPSQVFSRWHELRSEQVLKILSTTASLAVPFARRTICIAHGVPYLPEQGWSKAAALIASFKMANATRGARLVSVSDYSAVHLHAFFNVRTDAVIRNPTKPLYLEPFHARGYERRYVTYVGRLVLAKQLDRILPLVRDVLDENPQLRAIVIGDGPQRAKLSAIIGNDPRIEFRSGLSDEEIRDYLRETKLFLSGHPTEGLGITYIEALSQGCVVAMPASGGGIEIALPSLGDAVHLLPISLDREEALRVLRRALKAEPTPVSMEPYTARAVASAYLTVDRSFFAETTGVVKSDYQQTDPNVARFS